MSASTSLGVLDSTVDSGRTQATLPSQVDLNGIQTKFGGGAEPTAVLEVAVTTRFPARPNHRTVLELPEPAIRELRDACDEALTHLGD